MIKAGFCIFSDGREPARGKGEVGTSLVASRRLKRAMRRRRDRLLKRKHRMMETLIRHGLFPQETKARKTLELKGPFALRAKSLNEALLP